MGYHSELAIDMPRQRREPELPGAAERDVALHNARLLFYPLQGEHVWRYFGTQAEALRAKRAWSGVSHTTGRVDYWHSKEERWIG